eukprot:GHVP01053157.1.p1 GENE.GHVP01053157.1~~GHVP01053157.1.p1  ORF type:complete len:1275 (-),score=233.23 GHVP01053157.1:68-3388(-)
MEVDILRKNSTYWRIAKSMLLVLSTILECNGSVELSFVVYSQSHTVRVKMRNDGRSKVLHNLSQEFWAQLKWIHSKRSSGLRDLCVRGAKLPRRFAGEYSQKKTQSPTKSESCHSGQKPLILPTPQVSAKNKITTAPQKTSTSDSRTQREQRPSFSEKESGEHESDKSRSYVDKIKRQTSPRPQSRKEMPSQSSYRPRDISPVKPSGYKKNTSRESERSSFYNSNRLKERRNNRSTTPHPVYNQRPVVSASEHRNRTKEEENTKVSQSYLLKERSNFVASNSTSSGINISTDTGSSMGVAIKKDSPTPDITSNFTAPNFPSNNTPPDIPSNNTPPDMTSNTSPDIPSKVTPPDIPSKVTAPDITSNNTPPDITSNNSPPEIPSNNTPPDITSNNTAPEIPSNNTPPDIPSKVTATDIPSNITASEMTSNTDASNITAPDIRSNIPASDIRSNTDASNVASFGFSSNNSTVKSPKGNTIPSLRSTPILQQLPAVSISPKSQLSPELKNDFRHPDSPLQKDMNFQVSQNMHLVPQRLTPQNLHYNHSYGTLYQSPVLHSPSYMGMPRHVPITHAPAPPPPPISQYSYRLSQPMHSPNSQVPMPPNMPHYLLGASGQMIQPRPLPPHPRIKAEPRPFPQSEEFDKSKAASLWPKQEIIGHQIPPVWSDEKNQNINPKIPFSQNRPPSVPTFRPVLQPSPLSSPPSLSTKAANVPKRFVPLTETSPVHESTKIVPPVSSATSIALLPTKPKQDLKAATENLGINCESMPQSPAKNPLPKPAVPDATEIAPEKLPPLVSQKLAMQSEPDKSAAGQFQTSRKAVSLAPTNAQPCKKAVIGPVISSTSPEGTILGETERNRKQPTPNIPLQVQPAPSSPTTDGDDDLPIAYILGKQHFRKRKLKAEKAMLKASNPPPDQKEGESSDCSRSTKKARLADLAKRGKNLAAKSKPISRKVAAAKSKLSTPSNRNPECAVDTNMPNNDQISQTENKVSTVMQDATSGKYIMKDGDFAGQAPLLSLVTSLINAPTGQIPSPPPEAASWREFVMKMDPKTIARVSLDGAYTVYSTLNGKLFKGTSYPGLREEKDKLESAAYATVRDVLGFNFARTSSSS